MVRTLLAELRIGWWADPRCDPDPTLLIQHRVMRAGLAIPNRFVSPIWRRSHRSIFGGWCIGIAYRVFHLACDIADRVEDRDEIRTLFRRPIERAIGIDSRVPPVSGNLVVQVSRGSAPVPHGEDDISFHVLWSGGFCDRELYGGDPVGPCAEQLERQPSIEPPDHVAHLGHGLSGLNAPFPRRRRGT